MSPSWRSSAARSASTAWRCARGAPMSLPGPGLDALGAAASAWRTDRPLAMISRVSASGSGAVATARAWPMLISPCNSDCRTNSRKLEQSQQVGDVAARLVNQLADLVLRVAVTLDQLPIAFGLLDRVQILALDILDQRQLGDRRFVDLAHDRRDRVEPRALRRAPAPLAGDDLVIRRRPAAGGSAGARPARAIDCGELVEGVLVELHARLIGVGPDPRDLDLAHAAARRRGSRRSGGLRASPSSADRPAAEALPALSLMPPPPVAAGARSPRAPAGYRLPSRDI